MAAAGTKDAGILKNSFGCSMAVIGLPAVTLPRRGTLITSSLTGRYSFSHKISIVLNLLLVVLI